MSESENLQRANKCFEAVRRYGASDALMRQLVREIDCVTSDKDKILLQVEQILDGEPVTMGHSSPDNQTGKDTRLAPDSLGLSSITQVQSASAIDRAQEVSSVISKTSSVKSSKTRKSAKATPSEQGGDKEDLEARDHRESSEQSQSIRSSKISSAYHKRDGNY